MTIIPIYFFIFYLIMMVHSYLVAPPLLFGKDSCTYIMKRSLSHLYGSNPKFILNPSKLLEDARKLRDEATVLEIIDQCGSPTVTLVENSTISVAADGGRNKVEFLDNRSLFVTTAVLEKNAVKVDEQKLSSYTKSSSEDSVINVIERPLLVSRIEESKKRLELLSKLNGDSIRSKDANKRTLIADKVAKKIDIAMSGSISGCDTENVRIIDIVDRLILDEVERKRIDDGIDDVASDDDVTDNEIDAYLRSKYKTIDDLPSLSDLCMGLKPWWFRLAMTPVVKSIVFSETLNSTTLDKPLFEASVLLELLRSTDEIYEAYTNTYDNSDTQDITPSLENVLLKFDSRIQLTYKYLYKLKYGTNAGDVQDVDAIAYTKSSTDAVRIEDGENEVIADQTDRDLVDTLDNIYIIISDLQKLFEGDKQMLSIAKVASMHVTLDDIHVAMLTLIEKRPRFVASHGDKFKSILNIYGQLLRDYPLVAGRYVNDGIDEIRSSASPSPTQTPVIADSSRTKLEEAVDSMKDNIQKTMDSIVDSDQEVEINSEAERLINSYFDANSRKNGMALSKEGAGRFQSEVLNGLFVVTSVKMSEGAFIFEGRPLAKDTFEFASQIESKYNSSYIAKSLKYTIIMNEKYPSLDKGLEQAAIENLLGSSPALVVFPTEWTTSVQSVKNSTTGKIWSNLLSAASITLAGIFAGNCFGVFDPNGAYITSGILPDDFTSLAFMPIIIQTIAQLVESITGNLKGFRITSFLVPTMTLFTYGTRSAYLDMPKNRNDIFDTAVSSIATSMVLSMTIFVIGLHLTAIATSDVLATFPTVSLSLLQTSKVISQVLLYQLPNLAASTVSASTLSGAASLVAAPVHLHWLAIAGGLSFVASTLQLIPLDNSAGSKLSYAVLGREAFFVLNILAFIIKVGYLLPLVFYLDALSSMTALSQTRIIADYLIFSQLASSAGETQIAVDNLSDVSESRKVAYAGLVALLFASFFPFQEISNQVADIIDTVLAFLKSV